VLTLIYDGSSGDGNNGSNISTVQYTVSELSSTRLIFYEKGENIGDRKGARDADVNILYYEFLKQ
jgi:hypothetical protein